MKSFASFLIEPYLLERFQAKVRAANLTADEVIERLIHQYVEPQTEVKDKNTPYYAKANKGIPLWAMKPSQNNHRVIRAYFKALQENGAPVNLQEMLAYCTNSIYHDTYITPTAQNSSEKRFWNTYNQLKVDSPNSNGKVFEDYDYRDRRGAFLKVVTVWTPVKNTLMEFKDFFGG